MLDQQSQWQLQPTEALPDWFLATVRSYMGELPGRFAAQLLWQRGLRDPDQIPGFLDPNHYKPASPFEFGQEMNWAVERLQQAYEHQDTVAIWGDFDADGITATAVLWDGLGQFFPQHQRLIYFIPNRLTESHGLSVSGIDGLLSKGCQLIVTCDTGSTNLHEIEYARQAGIDIIVTDHHTLPSSDPAKGTSFHRPPVTAIINPRYLPSSHPLANLSGVAVAYKLVEALYQTLPNIPQRPLDHLLDLVAIGLIADLVQLSGDCRYLAQRGIEKLQQQTQAGISPSRPGIARLLHLCKRSGDRPTDIAFGIGPRINAISRIHGDASFGVELLTSQDVDRCRQLAEETELANARRKALQRDVLQQVKARLAQLDLSTTSVIVLSDPQWPVGILGLVAGQVAQEYGRPTILLTTDSETTDGSGPAGGIARGSARSVNQIDLYQLVQDQSHLLLRFGGHPYAAGLSLSIENLPLFTQAINRRLREQFGDRDLYSDGVKADLLVTVSELSRDLFRELKALEPYGMGNPIPRLLIQGCWFENVRNQNIRDLRGRKLRYIKTEFEIRDAFSDVSFPGVWWEHYRDDLPPGQCDAIAELDYNAYRKRYEIRLISVRSYQPESQVNTALTTDWILDWRHPNGAQHLEDASLLKMTECPSNWSEMQAWFRRARHEKRKLAIAYSEPAQMPPAQIWQQLVGIAKYVSRTGQTVARQTLHSKLRISDRTLQLGFQCLALLGFEMTSNDNGFRIIWKPDSNPSVTERERTEIIHQFLSAIQEEQFRQRYFYDVPLSTIQALAEQTEPIHIAV